MVNKAKEEIMVEYRAQIILESNENMRKKKKLHNGMKKYQQQ